MFDLDLGVRLQIAFLTRMTSKKPFFNFKVLLFVMIPRTAEACHQGSIEEGSMRKNGEFMIVAALLSAFFFLAGTGLSQDGQVSVTVSTWGSSTSISRS